MMVAHGGSKTVFSYSTLGDTAGIIQIGAGQALSFDPQSFTLAGVIALDKYAVTETPTWKEYGNLGLSSNGVPQAWWDCSAVILHMPGQVAVTSSVSRVQLTALSAACVRRTVSADNSGATTITTEAVDSGSAKTTVTSVNTATSASERRKPAGRASSRAAGRVMQEPLE